VEQAVTQPRLGFEIDDADVERFRKRAERYQGRPLQARMARGTLEAARLLRRPIRAAAPIGQHSRTGKARPGSLRRSVKAKAGGQTGTVRGAWVGPTAPHRHLVIQGTEPHSLRTIRPGRKRIARFPDGGFAPTAKLRHPGGKANPFVDRVAAQQGDNAMREVMSVLVED
jgi:hypothetical protein